MLREANSNVREAMSPPTKIFYQVTPSEVQNGDNPWKNGTGHNPSNWEVVQ